MIDRNQANQTGMLRTVLAHLNTHPEVLTAITFLATLKTTLGSNIVGLDDIAAGAGATEGVTENKDTARREAIRFGVPIAAAVKAPSFSCCGWRKSGRIDGAKVEFFFRVRFRG